MTNENAIREIEEIKSVIDSVFTFSVEAKKEALELAIELLKNGRKKDKDDVSCQYCKYGDKDSTDYPCSVCKNNHLNMFEWKETRKPNCVDCDHFGKGCNKCEKNEDE